VPATRTVPRVLKSSIRMVRGRMNLNDKVQSTDTLDMEEAREGEPQSRQENKPGDVRNFPSVREHNCKCQYQPWNCLESASPDRIRPCLESAFPHSILNSLEHASLIQPPQSAASKCHEPLPTMQRATLNTLRGPYSLNPHDVHSCSPSQGQARPAPYMAPPFSPHRAMSLPDLSIMSPSSKGSMSLRPWP
jgi:hypothetical protein